MRQRFVTCSLFVISVLLTVFLGHRWWGRLNQPTVLCPGCNVIIIDLDILRADAFDCNGNPGDGGYPPNLCEFVKDSFKFENNYSQSFWTLPSMVSTHTGLYPPEHGIESGSDILSSNILMAPKFFQDNGYRTFRLGKMDDIFTIAKETNTDKGYDSFLDEGEGVVSWRLSLRRMINLGRPFYSLFYNSNFHSPYILSKDDPLITSLRKDSIFPITNEEYDSFFSEILFEKRSKFFTDNISVYEKKRLINTFYQLKDVRDDKKIINKYLKKDWFDIYHEIDYLIYDSAIRKDAKAAERIQEVYRAKIKGFDKVFGSFLRDMESLNILDNSVIVFMSDHGEGFNEHGFLAHRYSPGAQYNEFLHVPLYIYIPRVRGDMVKEVSQNIDIFPTILEIIGVDNSALLNQGHGKSLVSLMDKRRLWSSFQDRFAISFSKSLVSIQDKKWKLIIDLLKEDRIELYDLSRDPKEQNNIADNGKDQENYLRNKLESTFGFSMKGLGLNWSKRFIKINSILSR